MPFLVVGVKLSGNSFNDRDLSLLNSVKYDSHSIRQFYSRMSGSAGNIFTPKSGECPAAPELMSEMSASTGIN